MIAHRRSTGGVVVGAGAMDVDCVKKSKACWGKTATYSFAMDLPPVALCEGHVWALSEGAPSYVRMQYAEEMEGLDDG